MRKSYLSTLVVLSGAAASIAQPTIDGRLLAPDQAYYGPAKFLQDQPTSFCNNTNVGCIAVGGGVRFGINNSNVLGVPGGPGGFLTAPQQADCAAVATGLEIAIPISQLGTLGANVRITGWVNGGGSDYLSNQVIGGFTGVQGNLGGDGNGNFNGSVAIDWTTKAGDQFISVAVPGSIPAATVAIDGTRDASYPTPQFSQTNETQFGDGTGGGIDCPGGGSEIANTSAMFGNADLGSGPQNYLFVFIGGNLECNFNRLNLMIDNGSGSGFNIVPSSCLPSADGLDKHVGMKFDPAFSASHYLSFRNGGTPYGIFSDFSQVQPNGSGGFIGGGAAATAITGTSTTCPPSDTAASGSELDGVYSRLDRVTNRLNVVVTGNFKQDVFLHLFLDTTAGGQNAILDSNVVIGVADGNNGHLGRFGPASPGGPALTFDAGLAPDYWLTGHWENGNRQTIDTAQLRTNGRDLISPGSASNDYGSFQGVDYPGLVNFDGTNFTNFTNPPAGIQLQDSTFASVYSAYTPRESRRVLDAFIIARGGYVPLPDNTEWTNWITTNAPLADRPRPNLITAAFNNSNIDGVTESSGAGAATATTGMEFSFDLDEIAWTGGAIRMAGFVSDSGSTRVSNQVVGGSGQTTNLGDPRNINFATTAGTQYAIVFCPQDFNQNGAVTVQDIFDFLAAYFAGSIAADYNKSGVVSVQDIFDFLSGYFSGPCV